MTTTLAPAAASITISSGAGLRVTQVRVLLSEWTKFRSLRSTVATLLIASVVMIGLGAMFAAITANQSAGFEPGATAISTSLTGTFFAQLAVGVLGVLLITGEYSTGMIRSSLTVVPSRLPMLWGKLAVFAVTVFLTMLAASFASFLVGQALLGDQLNASLSDAAALRSVLGAALYLTVAGLTAIALGALLRNTAAAITTLRSGVFPDRAADPAAAHIVDGPLRAIPAIQRRCCDARRVIRCRPPLDPVDRVGGDVRLRGGPDRVRRLAAPPRRRVSLSRLLHGDQHRDPQGIPVLICLRHSPTRWAPTVMC